MSNYEVLVPYVLSGNQHRNLSMMVRATNADEALNLARNRAWVARPLLGGDKVTLFGAPTLAPRRAA